MKSGLMFEFFYGSEFTFDWNMGEFLMNFSGSI